MKPIIVIPARYNSSRFPGKPLTLIAGKTMLQRVCEIAKSVQSQISETEILVATDDQRILDHAKKINMPAVITSVECKTGSDRILEALNTLDYKPDIVINLQGDAPLTPSYLITSLIKTLADSNSQLNSDFAVATPVIQLTWNELDTLRELKKKNPHSGTTVIINSKDEAIWFSKKIIPAIRKESKMRMDNATNGDSDLSPVFKHFGLYAYKTDMLKTFSDLPEGYYEKLEGLEQLRFLENGYKIKVVKYKHATESLSACMGVDTEHDAKFVENFFLKKEKKNQDIDKDQI